MRLGSSSCQSYKLHIACGDQKGCSPLMSQHLEERKAIRSLLLLHTRLPKVLCQLICEYHDNRPGKICYVDVKFFEDRGFDPAAIRGAKMMTVDTQQGRRLIVLIKCQLYLLVADAQGKVIASFPIPNLVLEQEHLEYHSKEQALKKRHVEAQVDVDWAFTMGSTIYALSRSDSYLFRLDFTNPNGTLRWNSQPLTVTQRYYLAQAGAYDGSIVCRNTLYSITHSKLTKSLTIEPDGKLSVFLDGYQNDRANMAVDQSEGMIYTARYKYNIETQEVVAFSPFVMGEVIGWRSSNCPVYFCSGQLIFVTNSQVRRLDLATERWLPPRSEDAHLKHQLLIVVL